MHNINFARACITNSHLKNGILYLDGSVDTEDVIKLLRSDILNKNIKYTQPIGFGIKEPVLSITYCIPAIGKNLIDLMNSMKYLIFDSCKGYSTMEEYNTEELNERGKLSLGCASFCSLTGEAEDVYTDNEEIMFNSTGEIARSLVKDELLFHLSDVVATNVILCLEENTGSISIEENVGKLQGSRFVPISSDYDLTEVISIDRIPYNGNIRIHYKRDVNEDVLINIFKNNYREWINND